MTDIVLGNVHYRFRRGQLYCADGRPVTLRAKSAMMFEVLLNGRGEILSKDELATAVWPGVAATDENISQCVSDIRKALGDGSHSILQTFPKRGYCLNVADAGVSDAPPRRWSALVRTSIVVAVLCAAAGLWYITSRPTEDILQSDRIAVLPFEDHPTGQPPGYLAVSLAEDLFIRLADLSALHVVPRSASFALDPHHVNIIETARALGTRYLITGTVRQTGAQLHISVQLIDGHDGTTIWDGDFESDRDDLVAYREALLEGVTSALSLTLSDHDRERLRASMTDSPAAFSEVLQGRRAISTFIYEDNLTAERHYRRAIELDPNYARPYAELAAAIAIRFENGWDVLTRADEEKAFFFANKAADLDPDLWLAQYVLGRLYSVVPGRDLDAAVYHLEKAMSLQPASDDVRTYYAVARNLQGNHSEAISILESVLSTHPSPPFWYYLSYGDALFNAKRYTDAIAPLEHCLMQSPTAPYCLRLQIANFSQLGRADDAAWAIEEYAALGHEPSVSALMNANIAMNPATREVLAAAYRRAGLPE